jgi:MFS family permease
MPSKQSEPPAEVASVLQAVKGQSRRVLGGGVSWRDTFAALKHRNFRLFFVGQLVSLIGTWMQTTAQGMAGLSVDRLQGYAGHRGRRRDAPHAAALPLGRFRGRPAFQAHRRLLHPDRDDADGLRVCGAGGKRTYPAVAHPRVGGVAMAFDMPARQAFMVEMTSHEDLMNAISLNSSIVNDARVVGPAVAGLLMAHVGMAWCFL